MSSLSGDGQSVVDAARKGYAPSADDRARIRRALAVQLGVATGSAVASVGWFGKAIAAGKALVTQAVVVNVAVPAMIGAGIAATSVAVHRPSVSHPVAASATALSLGGRFPPIANTSGFAVSASARTASNTSDVALPPTTLTEQAVPKQAVPEQAQMAQAGQIHVASTATSTQTMPTPTEALVTMPKARTRESGGGEPGGVKSKLSVAAEAELLVQAQRALHDGEPERALTRLEEHASLFPTGALSEERRAARILALCQSGRADEARAEARAFTQIHPSSPFAAIIASACSNGDSVRQER